MRDLPLHVVIDENIMALRSGSSTNWEIRLTLSILESCRGHTSGMIGVRSSLLVVRCLVLHTVAIFVILDQVAALFLLAFE